jgi:hypothetical protein
LPERTDGGVAELFGRWIAEAVEAGLKKEIVMPILLYIAMWSCALGMASSVGVRQLVHEDE